MHDGLNDARPEDGERANGLVYALVLSLLVHASVFLLIRVSPPESRSENRSPRGFQVALQPRSPALEVPAVEAPREAESEGEPSPTEDSDPQEEAQNLEAPAADSRSAESESEPASGQAGESAPQSIDWAPL